MRSGISLAALSLIAVVAASGTFSPALALTVAPVEPLLRLIESNTISNGNDGRLTVLLVGSDTRGSGIGLTDTVMVMSLNGNSIAAVSIPRDTAHIANPDGGEFPGRVNSILQKLRVGRTTEEAMAQFERVIEHLLEIEIDYHALMTFRGFETLVGEVEPVPVRINRNVRDPSFWDDPNSPSGVYFPASSDYELFAFQPGANVLCTGDWRTKSEPIPSQYWCRRALPFVRSRKGSGNSDFVRARRQQDFVVAAIRRVINRGNGGALSSLVGRASGEAGSGALTTNIPLTTSSALELFSRLSGASVAFQAVFSPPNYSTHNPGTTSYTLNLSAVREVTRQWFGGSGAPPASPPTAAPPSALPPATSGPTQSSLQTSSPPAATPSADPGSSVTPAPLPSGSPAATDDATAAPPGLTPSPATTGPAVSPTSGASPGPSGATDAPGGVASPTSVAVASGAPPAAGTPPPGGAAVVPTPPAQGPSLAPGPAAGLDAGALILLALVVLVVGGALAIAWWRLRRPLG